MNQTFHSLKIVALKHPIKDAISIRLEVPTQLKSDFKFNSGQHIMMRFIIDGDKVTRCYSINSSMLDKGIIEITVKRFKDGLVSNYINDQLKVGDEVEVSIPKGNFFVELNSDHYKSYYLFAAGSGITPIYSILKSILQSEKNSKVYLFYGNSNEDNIIFKEELEALELKHRHQLKVVHTLSHSNSSWTSWNYWQGKRGRIDEESIEWFINENPPIAQTTAYYICGPGKMNFNVRSKLMSIDVPKEVIHFEHFGGKIEIENKLTGFENAQLVTKINGAKRELKVASNQTILQSLKEEQIEVPYSCESGICGTCTAKVIHGEVKMKTNMALDEKEVKKGLILSCQAICMSEKVEIEY